MAQKCAFWAGGGGGGEGDSPRASSPPRGSLDDPAAAACWHTSCTPHQTPFCDRRETLECSAQVLCGAVPGAASAADSVTSKPHTQLRRFAQPCPRNPQQPWRRVR